MHKYWLHWALGKYIDLKMIYSNHKLNVCIPPGNLGPPCLMPARPIPSMCLCGLNWGRIPLGPPAPGVGARGPDCIKGRGGPPACIMSKKMRWAQQLDKSRKVNLSQQDWEDGEKYQEKQFSLSQQDWADGKIYQAKQVNLSQQYVRSITYMHDVEAWLDVSICGFWQREQHALFNVRGFQPFCKEPPKPETGHSFLEQWEWGLCNQWVIEINNGSFSLLIFSPYGKNGREAKRFLTELTQKLDKQK